MSLGNWKSKKCLGKRLEVPNTLLPDIRGLLKEKSIYKLLYFDGRDRAIVIAESLARVIAAIRIVAFVGGHISSQNTVIGPHRPPCSLCCASNRAIGVLSLHQPAPKYHTKGCSRSSGDSPGARTLVFAAFQQFSSCEFRASIAQTPFCAILWRSPTSHWFHVELRNGLRELAAFAEDWPLAILPTNKLL